MRPGFRYVISSIALAAALASLASAAGDRVFRAAAAEQYAHQTAFHVTIGAKPFDTKALTLEAFGKKAPLLKYGVLPVLVVVENKSQQPLDLRALRANLVGSDGRHVRAVAPENLGYLKKGSRRPSQAPLPFPLHRRKRNPLRSPEILTRAFTAQFVSPGDSVSGFFYFEARIEPGDRIYLDGIREVRSGNELMYFEFPLRQP
ncbi:MAG: hypothetical protein ACRD34_01240 [Bryobacteraceae bacterium]